MKRTKTLASYYSRVPNTQLNQSPSLPAPEENMPPPASQTQTPEQETTGTVASVVAVETQQNQNQPDPPTQEEIRTTRASLPAAELRQPPLEQGFKEGDDSDHELDPEEIIADPGLRKQIEEMHPNVRDDAKREYVLLGPCQPKGHKYPVKKIY